MTHCPRCDAATEGGARFCANCGENLIEASASPGDPHIGRTIGGAFLLQELIGVGAMGRVYKAEQVSLGKTVAVKVLHRHLLGDPSLEKRFQREARAAARLQHPGCISIIDFGKGEDGALFIVMEYLDGPNLGRVLQEGPMAWPRAARIMRQVAAALDEAHTLGIVHRDLKPENIVLERRRSDEDVVKVLDFGIAKVKESERDGVLTMVGAVCGTPEYMAPEQARGAGDLDARADVYAMGCILYQMLTGELPFAGDSVLAIVTKQMGEVPIRPTERCPGLVIPQALERLCMKALEKERDLRPASAREFGKDLDALQAAWESGVIEPRTSSQVPPPPPEGSGLDPDGQEETLWPGVGRTRSRGVLPEPALGTGESLIASVAAPSDLAAAREMERAITPAAEPGEAVDPDTIEVVPPPTPVTPSDGIDTVEVTPVPRSAVRPGGLEADIRTMPASIAPPAAAPAAGTVSGRRPAAGNVSGRHPAAGVAPLHPTPVLAGEVVESGTTEIFQPGRPRAGGIAAGAAIVLLAGAGAFVALRGAEEKAPPSPSARVVATPVRAVATTDLPVGPEAGPPPADVAAPPAAAAEAPPPPPIAQEPPASPSPEPVVAALDEDAAGAADGDPKGPRAKSRHRRKRDRARAGDVPAAPAVSQPAAPAAPPAVVLPPPDAPPADRRSRGERLYDSAYALFEKGKCEEAIEGYKEAMGAGYRKAEIHYELGRCYNRLSKHEEARRHLEKYLAMNPGSSKRKSVETMLRGAK